MSLCNLPYAILRSPLEQMIADDEGYRCHLYRCSAGKITIGYGYNLEAGMPEDEAMVLTRYRLSKLEAALIRRLPWFGKLDDRRKAALINMAYQMGIDGLLKFSRMLAACAAGDWDEAHAQAMDSKWATVDCPKRAARVAGMLLEPQEA